MKPVYALYPDGRSAERAVRNLRAAGIPDSAITVASAEPLEGFEFSELNKSTWMWYIASGGGLVGCAFATWLTRMTQLSWPIQTGNMPIATWWPNLIIMFEMTMLGGVLATVATLVISAGLLRPVPPLYDRQVTDGMILVGVEGAPEEMIPLAERALGLEAR